MFTNHNIKSLLDLKFFDKELLSLTKFNYLNSNEIPLIRQAIINISFKSIYFKKIRAVFFFFFLELISSIKPNINKSKKNHMLWKVKKGNLVSCHVNLRNLNLMNFLNYFTFTLSQLDRYDNFGVNKSMNKNTISYNYSNIFSLYQVKQDYDSKLECLELAFTLNVISNEEKLFLLSLYKIKLS